MGLGAPPLLMLSLVGHGKQYRARISSLIEKAQTP
jgi:hypothetical protein